MQCKKEIDNINKMNKRQFTIISIAHEIALRMFFPVVGLMYIYLLNIYSVLMLSFRLDDIHSIVLIMYLTIVNALD